MGNDCDGGGIPSIHEAGASFHARRFISFVLPCATQPLESAASLNQEMVMNVRIAVVAATICAFLAVGCSRRQAQDTVAGTTHAHEHSHSHSHAEGTGGSEGPHDHSHAHEHTHTGSEEEHTHTHADGEVHPDAAQ